MTSPALAQSKDEAATTPETSAQALSQGPSNTILVMDGSGSMWGQIDGVNKIVIAREVVDGLLDRFPADQNLGLTLYGHRTRGDCTDIQTVVAPGLGNRDAISQAVNDLNPRGSTPMTDAIIQAAESLRYTEVPATVILVSDGVETCNPDPCAAAEALEQAGIDFTAHVVGFDVNEADALAQMQCLADRTGGTFTTASNAEELSDALTQVAIAPEPEPTPEPSTVAVTFQALLGDEAGPLVEGPVSWTLDGSDPLELDGNPLEIDLDQGSYDVTAYWVTEEVEKSRQFIAIGQSVDVTMIFDVPTPDASIIAPQTANIGSTIQVGWTGPDRQDDYIGIGRAGSDGAAAWENYTYTREGNPLELQVPGTPGEYEIRYFLSEDREPIASATISVGEVEVGIVAPDSAIAGSTIQVGWTGPDEDDDYLGIGVVGSDGAGAWENYTYTREGNPLELQVPATSGNYVITYFLSQDRTALATRPITVTAVEGQITAPQSAVAGSTIQVGWTGPDYHDDYLGIGVAGSDGAAAWENYTYTREGNPLQLQVPVTPGTYDITYFLSQDRTVLTTTQIEVTSVTATIDGPASAPAGGQIDLSWTGPAYDDDYIGIGRANSDGASLWERYTYVREGSPLTLEIPETPGDYVLTYFLSQDRTAIATRPIRVE
jgi:Ca-activated chloride channel family protein